MGYAFWGVSCGSLVKATQVLEELHCQNEVSWTTLLTRFVQHGQGEEALKYFELMKLKGFSPTIATCLCILKACALQGALDRGQEIHADLIKEGELENNMVIGTALLFHELLTRNVVSWGALIAGHAQHDDGIMHHQILKYGMESDASIANLLISMYAKCQCLQEARSIFDMCTCRDEMTWGAIIAGYIHNAEDPLPCDFLKQAAIFLVTKGGRGEVSDHCRLHKGCRTRGRDREMEVIS
ncbi:hypothetical protein KP509_34G072900 [Ceratopteris richardii]|uniref:Pentatricopeptide repeat-containing protein n=1 Tax=Ceratopteris richardii TaxID=49495 RepID=A0A8T2QLL9_CERRI|nr:hypothetical protein KP509_34G072900 [Ceratopteris richardii]